MKKGKVFLFIGEIKCPVCGGTAQVTWITPVFNDGSSGKSFGPEGFSGSDIFLASTYGVKFDSYENICSHCNSVVKYSGTTGHGKCKRQMIYLNDFVLDIVEDEEYYITV